MPHRNNNVCFTCRYTSKVGSTCPTCGGPLHNMGYRWRFPAAHRVKAWKKMSSVILDHYRTVDNKVVLEQLKFLEKT